MNELSEFSLSKSATREKIDGEPDLTVIVLMEREITRLRMFAFIIYLILFFVGGGKIFRFLPEITASSKTKTRWKRPWNFPLFSFHAFNISFLTGQFNLSWEWRLEKWVRFYLRWRIKEKHDETRISVLEQTNWNLENFSTNVELSVRNWILSSLIWFWLIR